LGLEPHAAGVEAARVGRSWRLWGGVGWAVGWEERG
jgi:hypothetical protein